MTARQLIPVLGHLTANVVRLLQPYFPAINLEQVPIRVSRLCVPGVPDAAAATSLKGVITFSDQVWWTEEASALLRLLLHELDHVAYLRTRSRLATLREGLQILALSIRYRTWYPSQAIPVETQAQERKTAIILDLKQRDRTSLEILDQCV